MNFSIIITTLNKHRFIQQRLFEIYKYIPEEYIRDIIITNDDIFSDEMGKIIDKQISMKNTYPILLSGAPHPTSFAANVNRGVNCAVGDMILVTQDDVQISGNFMPSLEQAMLENWSSVFGRVFDFDTGWNKIHDRIIPYIEGWFIACSREIWDDIGGMDEKIAPYDTEDIDWSIRAKQKGYDLVNYTSCYLRHIGSQTIPIGAERRKVTEKNLEYIKNKWSKEALGKIYE